MSVIDQTVVEMKPAGEDTKVTHFMVPLKRLEKLITLARLGEKMRWVPVSEPPKKFGWYLGAVNPKNYKDLTQKQINEWRKQFGCTKVWYNPDSVGKWYEPSGTSISPECVGDRITHWTNLLEMPLPEPPKEEG